MSSNKDDLRALQDPRLLTGEGGGAISDGVGDAQLDPVEQLVEDVHDLRDPLTTSHPEDLQAKFGITSGATGATLAAEITSLIGIGDIDKLKAALVAKLQDKYQFSGTPDVTVLDHGDLDGRWEDDRALSAEIPTYDDTSAYIPIDDPDLIAEIKRVAPAWPFTVTHSPDSWSEPYVKEFTSEDGLVDLRTVDVLPDSPEDIKGNSEYEKIVARDTKDVDWTDKKFEVRRADNFFDGEDPRAQQPFAEAVDIEVSSTYVDEVSTKIHELRPRSELLGGFEDREKVLEGAGITAITAPEKEIVMQYALRDDILNLGQDPSVSTEDPIEQHPFTIVQEQRLISNSDPSGFPYGEYEIYHANLDQQNDKKATLEGRTVTVQVGPLKGGANRENLIKDELQILEDYVRVERTGKFLPAGRVEALFDRVNLSGPSGRQSDLQPRRIQTDRDLSFRLLVGGVSAGSTQNPPLGNCASPGLITVPIRDPSSTRGVSVTTGFPQGFNPDTQFLNIQKMFAVQGTVTVSIATPTGTGGGSNYNQTMMPFTARPEFDMLRSQNECNALAFTVPSLFDAINFPAAGATPGLVDIAWTVDFVVQARYDLWNNGAGLGEEDIQFEDFQPPQPYPVVDVRLDGVPGAARKSEIDIYDVPFQTSITTHRLKYDKNKMPAGYTEVKAYATYDISSEDNKGVEEISVQVPTGYRCDRVRVRFGTQEFTVYQTDPNIVPEYGGPVFKAVHLDTIPDPTRSDELGITKLIAIYDQQKIVGQDVIIKAWAHYVPIVDGLLSLDLEDLTSLTFNTNGDLPVTWWDIVDNLGNEFPMSAVFMMFFTDAESGDVFQVSGFGDVSPRKISGGIVYYWDRKLPQGGLFYFAKIRYGSAGVGEVNPEDIAILSVTNKHPDANLISVRITGLAVIRRYYLDRDGFYRDMINGFRIDSIEFWYNKNTIPPQGTTVRVYATYGPPSISQNGAQESISFSASQEFLMTEARFVGLDVADLRYDLGPSKGIIRAPLPGPSHVRAVLVIFSGFLGGGQKTLVQFKPTYLIPLKKAEWPVRKDWKIADLQLTGSVTPVAIWLKSEYGQSQFEQYTGLGGFKEQRLSAVRFDYYDVDLSTGISTNLDATLTVKQLINRKINPFLDGFGFWQSPSGLDTPYRVDFKESWIDAITVDGDSDSAEPIQVNAYGYEAPFEQGKLIKPQYVVLNYNKIRSLKFKFTENREWTFNPRQNMLLKNTTKWMSNPGAGPETVEIRAASSLRCNQVIYDLDPECVELATATMKIKRDKEDFTVINLLQGYASVASLSGYPAGAQFIRVTDASRFISGSIVRIGTEFVRVRRVLSGNVLSVDPLAAAVLYGDDVVTAGWDFGEEPIEPDTFIFQFVKAAAGSVQIREIWTRIERRYGEHYWARNVATDDAQLWMPAGSEKPDEEASLSCVYSYPRRINRILLDQLIPADVKIFVSNAQTGEEQEVFYSRDEDRFGYLYSGPERTDDITYDPESFLVQAWRIIWEKRPFNPSTGLFHPVVRTAIPQFAWDGNQNKLRSMLDDSLLTAWLSREADSTADVVEVIADMRLIYEFDRLALVTSSAGASCDVYQALGDASVAWDYLTSISDIAAPNMADVVDAALTSDVSPGDTFIPCDPDGFEPGAYVQLFDDTRPYGEWHKVVSTTLTGVNVQYGLVFGYTTADNATLEQSNVLRPGWINPIICGVNYPGPHIRGPRSHEQALVIPSGEARYVKFRFSNIPADSAGKRILKIQKIDIRKAVTIP